jgi:hypothetical protein
LIQEGGLDQLFREVKTQSTDRSNDAEDLVCLEQLQPSAYSGRPTDVVADLVNLMKPKLWRIASSTPGGGYRRYYLHLTPPAEQHRLPQFASLWALFFYFGSVVRYWPATPTPQLHQALRTHRRVDVVLDVAHLGIGADDGQPGRLVGVL